MSDKEKSRPIVSESNPLALLVDAANAQSQESSSKHTESAAASSTFKENGYREAAERSAAAHSREQQRAFSQAEWDEAMHRDDLQRKALERERVAIERENLEQQHMERELMRRQAALTGYGGGRGRVVASQEAEYLQQLRLEALVQQRRQETLSQLSIAQELGGGYDIHALLQAQQLRQAAILRQAQHEQRMMFSGARGASHLTDHVMSHSGDGGRNVPQDISEEVQRMEERNRKEKYLKQQQLANLGFGQQGTSRAAEISAALAAEGIQKPHASLSLYNKKSPNKIESKTNARDKTSKVTIVPCPARGMPLDHDVTSAYFKIPPDIKHGTELVCSFYGCRNSGAQFKFCTTCDIPVSRWNFTKLHQHEKEGEVASPSSASGKKEGWYISKKNTKKNDSPRRKKKTDAAAVLAQLVKRGAKEVQADGETQNGSQPENNYSGDTKKRAEARRDQWEDLLRSRPTSGESIVDWVQQVLAVSDIDTNIDGQPAESSEEAGASKPEGNASEKTPENQGLNSSEPEKTAESGDVHLGEKVDEVKEKPASTNGQEKNRDDSGSSKDSPREEDKPASSSGENDEGKEVSDSGVPTGIPVVAPSDGSTNKMDDASYDGTTSSDDSVDLRASKKLKTS